MLELSRFIPNGSFITGNPIPFNTDVRDMTSIKTDKNDVIIAFGDPKVHIVTKNESEAKQVVTSIFETIADCEN